MKIETKFDRDELVYICIVDRESKPDSDTYGKFIPIPVRLQNFHTESTYGKAGWRIIGRPGVWAESEIYKEVEEAQAECDRRNGT